VDALGSRAYRLGLVGEVTRMVDREITSVVWDPESMLAEVVYETGMFTRIVTSEDVVVLLAEDARLHRVGTDDGTRRWERP